MECNRHGAMKKILIQTIMRLEPALKSAGVVILLVIPADGNVTPQTPPSGTTPTILSGEIAGAEIQRALDALPAGGGEVLLPAGTIEVRQPIILQRDNVTLCGAGDATVLRLADKANCPVLILGEPVNAPSRTVRHLRVAGLFIDGNRAHQSRELWHHFGEGSEIRNNGITVQNVSDSVVENVTCVRNRSGGLVTTRGVRRLTVRHLTASDNEFDGLACYQTEDSLFTDLNLHHNPGAGISLDLAFNHNVVSNAVLTANDLGIFMRASHDNRFADISIRDSRHYGVFMADVGKVSLRGPQIAPGTECTGNLFTNLFVANSGRAAIRINDASCTNNFILRPQFRANPRGDLSLARPGLVTVQ
jgi:hypothetical protein